MRLFLEKNGLDGHFGESALQSPYWKQAVLLLSRVVAPYGQWKPHVQSHVPLGNGCSQADGCPGPSSCSLCVSQLAHPACSCFSLRLTFLNYCSFIYFFVGLIKPFLEPSRYDIMIYNKNIFGLCPRFWHRAPETLTIF